MASLPMALVLQVPKKGVERGTIPELSNPLKQKGPILLTSSDAIDLSHLNLQVRGIRAKVKKESIRKLLGRRRISSNRFVVKGTGKKWMIYGSGLGHGVGLCQYGAFGLAKKKWKYRKILAHYFPSLKIEKYVPGNNRILRVADLSY